MKTQPYTTHRLLRRFCACKERYDFLKTWAGDRGPDEPIYLSEIIRHNGIKDALWALRALTGGLRANRVLIAEVAIYSARTQPQPEDWNQWADRFLDGTDRSRASAEEAAAAVSAVSAAAASSAAAAAWAAASSAAWAAAASSAAGFWKDLADWLLAKVESDA